MMGVMNLITSIPDTYEELAKVFVENLPKGYHRMDIAADSVSQLIVQLEELILAVDTGIGDIPDSEALHNVLDHELLDVLVVAREGLGELLADDREDHGRHAGVWDAHLNHQLVLLGLDQVAILLIRLENLFILMKKLFMLIKF